MTGTQKPLGDTRSWTNANHTEQKVKKKKFANCTHLMVMAFITICSNSVLNRQHPQFHITMLSLSNIAIDNIIIFS